MTRVTSLGTARPLGALLLAAGLVACASRPPVKPAPQEAAMAKPALPAETAATVESDPWASASLLQPPMGMATGRYRVKGLTRFSLTNGLQVVVVSNRDLPVIDVQLSIRASEIDETADKLGVARLTVAMLRQGTLGHSADELSAAIDQVGADLTIEVQDERTVLGCHALSGNLGLCLGILADLVSRPTFPEHEMQEARAQLLALVQQVRDDKDALADLHFANQLYGSRHPKGMVLDAADVAARTRADLVRFHAQYFVATNAILSIAGDIEPATHQRLIEQAFGKWRRGKPNRRKEPATREVKRARALLVDKPDLAQTRIVLGHAGLRRRDPDFYATELVNYTLGGGAFSSRLMDRIRSKGGKTYGIRSDFTGGEWQGDFRIIVDVPNPLAVPVVQEIREEMKRMHKFGPTEPELHDAKAHLAGSYALRLQTPNDLANAVVEVQLQGLPLAEVELFPVRVAAVPIAQAKKAAAFRLHPDSFVLVMVGKSGEIAPALQATGLPFERGSYLDPIGNRQAKKSP